MGHDTRSESTLLLATPDSIPSGHEEHRFFGLMRMNVPFRCFFVSFVVNKCGDWFTYLASIALLSKYTDSSKMDVSILVVIRLMPHLLVSPFGGTLADSFELKSSMIYLDVIGSITALLFLPASRSRLGIFIVTGLIQMGGGMYEPCRSAILPLLVHQDEAKLKLATSVTWLAWSTVVALASSLGGFVAKFLGFRSCFLIDSSLYLVSAAFLGQIQETFRTDPNVVEQSNKPGVFEMVRDGLKELCGSKNGALVLIKATGCLMFGASDLMNVGLAEDVDGELQSDRLGILFAGVGLGCWLGPTMTDRLFKANTSATVFLRLCVGSLCIVAIGFGGIALSRRFWVVWLWTILRASGTSILWINSSLLIQRLAPTEMLGRYFAADNALATSSEAFSAVLGGLALDQGWSPHELAAVLSASAVVFALGWMTQIQKLSTTTSEETPSPASGSG